MTDDIDSGDSSQPRKAGFFARFQKNRDNGAVADPEAASPAAGPAAAESGPGQAGDEPRGAPATEQPGRLRRLFSLGGKDEQDTPAPVESVATTPRDKPMGRIRRALARTGRGIGNVFLGRKAIDDDLLEQLETQLLTADLGIDVTTEVIRSLTDRVRRKELDDVDALHKALNDILVAILRPCEQALDLAGSKPRVLLVVGVNGVGKTTTIGKLAHQLMADGRSVMLAAGDTFRAAAVEQLQVWGERNGVPVIAQHSGADSASVIYDAVESARARGVDVLIADTAGRLHTKSNLMEELRKIKRVLGKLDGSAPHEVLLVLDAGTGQNAVVQMQQFHEAVGVTGVALTKLDGTAKGGVIFALCRRFGVPVRYIGVGEGVEDLQPFRAEQFVSALLQQDEG
ncbi:MAG: signal recognition particle-docking protein FtsY [Porticoccaceae bacterium]